MICSSPFVKHLTHFYSGIKKKFRTLCFSEIHFPDNFPVSSDFGASEMLSKGYQHRPNTISPLLAGLFVASIISSSFLPTAPANCHFRPPLFACSGSSVQLLFCFPGKYFPHSHFSKCWLLSILFKCSQFLCKLFRCAFKQWV